MFQILNGLKYLHDRLISHRGMTFFPTHWIEVMITYFTFRYKGLFHLLNILLLLTFSKPENILLCSPGAYPKVQIADFGLARPKAYQETMNVCGTVAYLPPEGILALDRSDLGYVGMPADCWSAGIILYSMLTCVNSQNFFPIGIAESYINRWLFFKGEHIHLISRATLRIQVELAKCQEDRESHSQ